MYPAALNLSTPDILYTTQNKLHSKSIFYKMYPSTKCIYSRHNIKHKCILSKNGFFTIYFNKKVYIYGCPIHLFVYILFLL